MKKKILITLIALVTGLGAITAFTTTNEKLDCQNGRCRYMKSDFTQCKNCCQEGSAYCWNHNHQ